MLLAAGVLPSEPDAKRGETSRLQAIRVFVEGRLREPVSPLSPSEALAAGTIR